MVVTGISQTGEIGALEAALQSAGLLLGPIQLIGPEDSTQGAASSMGMADRGLMTGGCQGTVPGITSRVPTGGGYGTRYFRSEALGDRLGDLEIPDDHIRITSTRYKRAAARWPTSRSRTRSPISKRPFE